MPANKLDLEELHRQLRFWTEERELPSAAIFAMQGQTLLDDSYFGYKNIEEEIPVDKNSLFRLASATKIFTSVAFLTLVDQRQVRLTDPVSKYLPEYQSLKIFTETGSTASAKNVLTIEDLLRHSNGFAYGDNEPYQSALNAAGLVIANKKLGLDWSHDLGLREWARTLSAVPMEFEAGTKVSYGLGHDIIGAVIEVITGISVEQFFKESLNDPLNLQHTFFTVPDHRKGDLTNFYSIRKGEITCLEQASTSPFLQSPSSISGGGGWDMFGNGGLVSNTRDFSRLLRMILNKGTLDGVQLLKPETTQLLWQNQTETIGKILPNNGYSYGFASLNPLDASDQKKTFGGYSPNKMWWGGSTNTHFWFDPELDFHGIFLTHTFPFRHLDAAEIVDRAYYQQIDPQS
ncbi:MAG: CubicO group peptidase (beta-lactamase class C family) [Candidatus Azotimanducaceae bacterium]|jgi:CubicO group peptidase (beta-lactamase class C family)